MENSRTGIHLPTGVINQIPQNNPTFQMDSYKSNEAWKDLLGNESEISLETLLQSLFGAKPAIATMQEHSIDETIETDTTYKMISVVPAYYQSSTHGDGSMVPPPPNYIGIADDPWAIYDGCAPISGAMVIAYWHDHGYPNIPDPSYSGAEDLLIDHCHVEMNTSFFGSTNSFNIGQGIEEVTDNIYFYDFDYDLVVANFNKVHTEIINDRPLVFVLYDSPEYDYHAVCVVGFLDDTWVDFMYVHNTWDTSIHSIAWGAFDIPNSSLVAVYPGS
jgi:hypothetical protein